MPGPSAFPLVALGGPQYNTFIQLEDEYPNVLGPAYSDGGRDTFSPPGGPVRRWRLTYDGMTNAQAQVLDDHFTSARGVNGLTFNLTWRDTTVYSGVRYSAYRRSHSRRYINSQRREIELVKWP